MIQRKIHIIISVPIFLFLYSYTAVIVLLILLMAYIQWKKGIMAIYPDVSWFGHARLLRIPLLKQMLLMTNYIPMRLSTITNTRRMLEDLVEKARYRTVAIFPEGTRSLDGKLNSFYRGFIHLLIDYHDLIPVSDTEIMDRISNVIESATTEQE